LTVEGKEYLKIVDGFKEDFESAMDDDINTPLAVSAVFEFVNKSNKYLEGNNVNGSLCKYALDVLTDIGNVLTLFQPSIVDSGSDSSNLLEKVQRIVSKYENDVEGKSIEELMDILLQVREKARKDKDWNTSDSIRSDLGEIGFEIQDTSSGPVWRKNKAL
jgi:cysteinyl-tRNA synthetase